MQPTRNQGFTLIELLVVIAIIAVLAAILFPVFKNAKDASITSACANNLRQLGAAIAQYCDDNAGRYPYQKPSPKPKIPPNDYTSDGCVDWWWIGYSPNWGYGVDKYTKSYNVFSCPGCSAGILSASYSYVWHIDSYAGNGFIFEQALASSAILSSSRTVMLYGGIARWRFCIDYPHWSAAGPRTAGYWYPVGQLGEGATHNDGYNCLYADGHVKWHHWKELAQNSQWWAPDGKVAYFTNTPAPATAQ